MYFHNFLVPSFIYHYNETCVYATPVKRRHSLYSKTCLQGTPQYPGESNPTCQVSFHHRFLSTGKLVHHSKKVPLVTVSLEDRYYSTVSAADHRFVYMVEIGHGYMVLRKRPLIRNCPLIGVPFIDRLTVTHCKKNNLQKQVFVGLEIYGYTDISQIKQTNFA